MAGQEGREETYGLESQVAIKSRKTSLSQSGIRGNTGLLDVSIMDSERDP